MDEQQDQVHHEEHERPAPGHREGGEEGAEHVYQPPRPDAAVEDDTPGPGGYPDRDPKDAMPRIPSAPETQDEEQ